VSSTHNDKYSFTRLKELLTRRGMSERFQACWLDSYEAATEKQLDSLRQHVPWLPDDYLEFLRITNGCVLECFVFYGIGTDHPFSIEKHQSIVDYYGRDAWLACGHDASGDMLAIGRDGTVALAGSDPPPDEPVPLCDSFHSLIEDICCGQGYVDYCRGSIEGSEWFAHIAARGWAAAP